MLSKECFNNGVDKLLTEYSDRGFKMTKQRSLQWYNYMKDISDSEFKKKVDKCLMTCRHVPFMADVMDLKEKDEFSLSNAAAYKIV